MEEQLVESYCLYCFQKFIPENKDQLFCDDKCRKELYVNKTRQYGRMENYLKKKDRGKKHEKIMD